MVSRLVDTVGAVPFSVDNLLEGFNNHGYEFAQTISISSRPPRHASHHTFHLQD